MRSAWNKSKEESALFTCLMKIFSKTNLHTHNYPDSKIGWQKSAKGWQMGSVICLVGPSFAQWKSKNLALLFYWLFKLYLRYFEQKMIYLNLSFRLTFFYWTNVFRFSLSFSLWILPNFGPSQLFFLCMVDPISQCWCNPLISATHKFTLMSLYWAYVFQNPDW